MMAADMAPNLYRERFGFHGWAGHDEACWRELKREADARASIGRKRCRNRLFGIDRSPPALAAAKANAMRAGIPALIELSGGSLGELDRPAGLDEECPGLLITNPPYGERLANCRSSSSCTLSWASGPVAPSPAGDWHCSPRTPTWAIARACVPISTIR